MTDIEISPEFLMIAEEFGLMNANWNTDRKSSQLCVIFTIKVHKDLSEN